MAAARPVGVAVIGCGAVARLQRLRVYPHPHVAALGRVVATCDAVPERARELAGGFRAAGSADVAPYGDLDAALADDRVTAVDICTPHPSHAAVALRAIEAGRHVLVEKPIATTTRDARRMIDAARAGGVVLAVNEQFRFMVPLLRARELVAAGAIGQLAALRIHRAGPLGAAFADSGWRQDAALAGGGMVLDQGPHYFHALRLVAGPAAGEITHAAAVATTARDDWRPGTEDTAAALLRFESGAIGEVLFCWATRAPAPGPWLTVYGTDGNLEVGASDGALVWQRAVGRGAGAADSARAADGALGREVVEPPADRSAAGAPDPALVECAADFLRAAGGMAPPSMPGEEGLRDLLIVEAVYRAMRSGQLEAVERAGSADRPGVDGGAAVDGGVRVVKA